MKSKAKLSAVCCVVLTILTAVPVLRADVFADPATGGIDPNCGLTPPEVVSQMPSCAASTTGVASVVLVSTGHYRGKCLLTFHQPNGSEPDYSINWQGQTQYSTAAAARPNACECSKAAALVQPCRVAGGGGGIPGCDGLIDHQCTQCDQSKALVKPRRWLLNAVGAQFLLIEYDPNLAARPEFIQPENRGIYFATNATATVGVIGVDRWASAQKLLDLLRAFAGDGPSSRDYLNGNPPQVSLQTDWDHSQAMAKHGRYTVRWVALEQQKGGFFPFGAYPQLTVDHRPAQIQDVIDAGFGGDLQAVP